MNGQYVQLLEAIKKHAPSLEEEDFKQISKHGISGGFNGFIYYKDTVKFFDSNEDLITDFLGDEAHDYSYKNMFDMFNALYDGHSLDEFKNWASWYVAEVVADRVNNYGLEVWGRKAPMG